MIAFGLDWRRASRDKAAHRAQDRARAYSRLLSRAGVILHTAGGLHLAMEIRSGLKEGLDITLHQRKPLDPLELMDRLRMDTEPLYEAWSDVWTFGTKEAVTAANRLVDACAEVMSAGTRTNEDRPWLVRFIAGEKWSDAQLAEWKDCQRRLAEARKALAEVARKELGVEIADLFAGGNEPKSPTPLASGAP